MVSHRFQLVLECSSRESNCFLCKSRLEGDQSSEYELFLGGGGGVEGAYKEA